MVDIKKYKINGYNCFDIGTDYGIFNIWFGGNLDLYWSYKYNSSILDAPPYKEFYITKENYFLFSLFDRLYDDTVNYRIFEEEDPLCRKDDFSNPNKLVKDNKIEWHSDDFDYEDASLFIIEKLKDCYKLTFKMSVCDDYVYSKTYSVRISNSGSRYGYFNMIFMRMYNELCRYDPNFHQIHVEEYLYHKKLVKRKETI